MLRFSLLGVSESSTTRLAVKEAQRNLRFNTSSTGCLEFVLDTLGHKKCAWIFNRDERIRVYWFAKWNENTEAF
jgi:hypothetical protein